MSSDSPVEPTGKTLGGYRIIERLGAGAMGTVYKAHDENLDRYVAIKVLAASLDQDPTCVERFKREARAIAGLRHPNLMHVYNVGTDGETNYFSMEYIEGTPLNKYLKLHGPLSVPEALRIAGQILSALAKVHDAGIIHRDLKPGNVMIDSDGRVILLDFGLSKDATQLNLTGAGTIMGTPDYMAPEQVEGEAVGPNTDIYALGIMLYEMLTQKLPFRRKSAVMTMRAHCEDDAPPVRTHRADLPEELDAILSTAMARNPAQRYPRVIALAAQLDRICSTPELADLAQAFHTATSAATVMSTDPETQALPPKSVAPKASSKQAGTSAQRRASAGARTVKKRRRKSQVSRPPAPPEKKFPTAVIVALVGFFMLWILLWGVVRRGSRRDAQQPTPPTTTPPQTHSTLPTRTWSPASGGEVPGVFRAPVKVLLTDGTVVDGVLLSASRGGVKVERGSDGKAVEVDNTSIRAVFCPGDAPETLDDGYRVPPRLPGRTPIRSGPGR